MPTTATERVRASNSSISSSVRSRRPRFAIGIHTPIMLAAEARCPKPALGRRPSRPYRACRHDPPSRAARRAPGRRDADRAPRTDRSRVGDWVALALPGLIWGSSFYLIAEGLESFEPFLVTWLRIVFGLARRRLPCPRHGSRFPRAAWPRLALLGVVWVAVPLSLFPLAEQRVSSSVTGMLNGATPIFTAIVAALIVRRLPPAAPDRSGSSIGLVGIVLIAAPTWSDERRFERGRVC